MNAIRTRLAQYLHLARDVCLATTALADQATRRLPSAPRPLNRRDLVLAGIVLKIDSAFRALIEDCHAVRSEAMHHLKTMAESFIYYHLVTRDETDATARALLAEACHNKLILLRANPDWASQEDLHAWEVELGDLTKDGVKRIGKGTTLERLAKDHSVGLGEWYTAVYRSACEPAHIGDLIEFMPPGRGPIQVGSPTTAEVRSVVAIWHALHIMFAMMRAVRESNILDLKPPVEELEARLKTLQTQSQDIGGEES